MILANFNNEIDSGAYVVLNFWPNLSGGAYKDSAYKKVCTLK